jgi:hypothetical protein
VLLEFAAIVPDVAASPSHPAPSLADHDTDPAVLFLSVTEVLVAVVPKLTWSGVTSNASGGVETLIDTATVAEPLELETATFAV